MRALLKKKRRVVIKIGSSSLQHTETGDMDYIRSYVVTVDPREDGSADITYDIDWLPPTVKTVIWRATAIW